MGRRFRPEGAAKQHPIDSVRTRCIVKTSGFTRAVCKIRGFYIKFEGFLENQKPPENRQKVDFSGDSPFTMHLD